MSNYAVLLGDDAREFLTVADSKTERICKEKLGFLAENPYLFQGENPGVYAGRESDNSSTFYRR